MTYTLAMSADEEALIERCAARENISVPDFMLRATLETIRRHAHAPRPKARDEMTDEEFYATIERSFEDARQGKTIPAKEAFAKIRRNLGFNEV